MKNKVAIITLTIIMIGLTSCGYFAEDRRPEKPKRESEAVSEPAPEAVSEPEAADGKCYEFVNGELKVYLSEDEYDAFTADNTDNQLALKRQDIDQETMDQYMQLGGYALKAVKVGDKMGNSKYSLVVNIKKDKYKGLDNIGDLSHSDQKLLGDTLVAGFNIDDYEIKTINGVTYYVFELDKGVFPSNDRRYATVYNGTMYYFFVTSDNEITDEMRKEVDTMVQNVRFD